MVEHPKPKKRSIAWAEGYHSQREHRPPSKNPYRSKGNKSHYKGDIFDEQIESQKRKDWFDGWYDAYFQLRYPDWLSL